MTTTSPLANMIAARRRDAGLSLREVATRAGISVSYLCDIEHGSRTMAAETAAQISLALGMSVRVTLRQWVCERQHELERQAARAVRLCPEDVAPDDVAMPEEK